MKKFFPFILLILPIFPVLSSAQTGIEQTVRGVVIEKNTQETLPGATVIVSAGGREFGTATNDKGEFVLSDIPVGRCNISVSMVGFTSYISNNVLVYSGKQTVLEIALEENILVLEEVVVTPKIDKELPLNRMAVVSSRMMSSEEANRYAGTFAGDPARMVAGFAGVIANNDERNDIVVRGNTPAGLLWRLDGFEIPNPNHFGAMGAAGGAIGMINNNMLANSDFFTGAFPAEYGNATSGVFDLRLRNGNNQKNEFMGSVGLLGIEVAAEGPLSKKTGASYIINGRYAFFGVLKAMGVDLGFGGIPVYQDVSSKINIPLKNGNLSWITMLGSSSIEYNPDFDDPSEWSDGDWAEYEINHFGLIFTGLNYTHRFNSSTRLENRFSFQYTFADEFHSYLEYPSEKMLHKDYEAEDYSERRFTWQSVLNHRFNTKNLLKSGIGADFYYLDIYRDFLKFQDFLYVNKGNSALLKAFVQWQYRFNNSFSVIPGVYAHYLTLNDDYFIEPRLGFKWDMSPKTAFTLGGGLHSQLQHCMVQMYKTPDGVMPNKNLKMNKSWQAVAGYHQKIGEGMHLKTEIYYQGLFDIAVLNTVPEESYLNYAQEDRFSEGDFTFVNKGTGRNYGIELTFEKFFQRNYYFLLTGSLYDSKYTPLDKIERPTRFAGLYAFNALFGYEWKTGKRSLFSVNTKLATIGGKREVPMNYNPVTDDWEFDYTLAYKRQLPAYFRLDLNVNMKTNYKRHSLEWFIEIVNLTDHENIWARAYDRRYNEYYYETQYGFMPIFGVRVFF
ncbi:MAG: TonB-dependent receptor [Marinilabiliaceae bacterium]|nr:TonB-dependent receptor [Marinilabiliaceae bacterium]